jgi:hypothetical protein
MKNPIALLRSTATLAIVLGATVATYAQMPVNNDTWKTRCNVLATSAPAIVNGSTPAALVSATRGVAGRPFFVLGVDRSQADQHYVACTMYYLAAISARTGNGGKADPDAADKYGILAAAELKLAHGESLSFTEQFKRLQVKFSGLTGETLTLTPNETSSAIDAATTMPLTIAPAGTKAER